jgi:hypothetical protein
MGFIAILFWSTHRGAIGPGRKQGQWEVRANLCSVHRHRFDFHLAADQYNTLIHSQQTQACTLRGAFQCGPHIKSDSIVTDRQFQLCIALPQFNQHMLCPCVPRHVG